MCKYELRNIVRKVFGDILASNFKAAIFRYVLQYSKYEPFLIKDNLRRGFKFIYDPRTDIGQSLFYKGSFEEDVLSIIEKHVKEGDIALDVGGNWGLHALLLAKLVRNSGFVYVFEPYDAAYDILVDNIKLNKVKNVELIKSAMGNYCGKIGFNVYDDPAYNSINRTDRKQFLQTVQVDITTIDDFVRLNKIKRLDFIKIDVEGYEDKVIEGALKTIATLRPKIICEIFEGNSLAIPAEQLISQIVSLEYAPYIIKDGEIYPYIKHNESLYNYLFIPLKMTRGDNQNDNAS